MSGIVHYTNGRAYTDDQIAALPTLEPSLDSYARLGTWDDSVSGILRPVPLRDLALRQSITPTGTNVVANTTTETSMPITKLTVPAGAWESGTLVTFTLFGTTKNTTASGANTATVRVKLGGNTIISVPFSVPQSAAAGDHAFFIRGEALWFEFTGLRPFGGWTSVLSGEAVTTQLSAQVGSNNLGVAHSLGSALEIDVTAQHTIANANTSLSLTFGSIIVSADS